MGFKALERKTLESEKWGYFTRKINSVLDIGTLIPQPWPPMGLGFLLPVVRDFLNSVWFPHPSLPHPHQDVPSLGATEVPLSDRRDNLLPSPCSFPREGAWESPKCLYLGVSSWHCPNPLVSFTGLPGIKPCIFLSYFLPLHQKLLISATWTFLHFLPYTNS